MLREHQASERYLSLLRKANADPLDSLASVGLAERRAHRAALAGQIRIAAFGTNDWEHRGLWQAFQQAGDFALFDYVKAGSALRGSAATRRRMLGLKFESFVRELERGGPIHLVFCYASGAYVDPEMLRRLGARGIWTVVMSLDDKQQIPGFQIDDLVGWQLEVARAADLYWTTWRAGIDWLSSSGARPWFAPEAASPEYFKPLPLERDLDVLWVGRRYGQRAALVSTLRAVGVSVAAFGPGWEGGPVPFEKMVELYSRSRIVLGMGGVGQTDRIKHLKGRDFEVPMSGAVYLTSFNPELTDSYVIGDEVLCYSSPEECAEVVIWLLARPGEQERIRARVLVRARRDHTWEKRISGLLGVLSGETENNEQ